MSSIYSEDNLAQQYTKVFWLPTKKPNLPLDKRMKMRSKMIMAVFSLWVALAQATQAQTGDTTQLRVKKTTDFQITGDGTSPNWNAEKWLILPERPRSKVKYETKIKLLYSDSGVYCLYQCEDNKITATLQEDFSDLFNEDVVEAFFWTDENTPLYFEYELSPLNHELAILVPNFKGYFLGWRPWHFEGGRKTRHATHITVKNNQTISWTAEFFIPYALLKPLQQVPPHVGTRWRANFYRIDYDDQISEWSWQLTRTNFHDYERFGILLFD
jgi:hypothetical protein